MASIAPMDFYMIDNWPGPFNPNRSTPGAKAQWDSTKIEVGNNCSTPSYPSGTKIMGFNEITVTPGGAVDANIGGFGLIYLKYICSTTAIDLTACDVVVMACGSDGGLGPMACTREYTASNDVTNDAPQAIAVADCTPNSYVWCWNDGVCPDVDITALDITGFETDGALEAGRGMACAVADSSVAQLGLCAVSEKNDGGYVLCGQALKDDT